MGYSQKLRDENDALEEEEGKGMNFTDFHCSTAVLRGDAIYCQDGHFPLPFRVSCFLGYDGYVQLEPPQTLTFYFEQRRIIQ